MSEVVSIFGRSKKKETDTGVKVSDKNKDGFDFEAIMKKNLDNEKRQKRDREKNNRGVTRSYRLKT